MTEQKPKLGDLVADEIRSAGVTPSETYIYELISADVLDQYSHRAAISAARDNGLKLDQCCMCHKVQSYNNEWVKVSEPGEFARYEGINPVFDTKCEQKFRNRWS